MLPVDQVDRVLNQEYCEIDLTFLGFMETYKVLSSIIPNEFTVVDLGCAYNPQCFYFQGHKKYIAVDVSQSLKFQSDNCVIYIKKISEFIRDDIKHLDMNTTFAICNYVPPWHGNNSYMVRKYFKNVFTFYPSNDAFSIVNSSIHGDQN